MEPLRSEGDHGAGGKARGANLLIREYAKSSVSPSRLAAVVRRTLAFVNAKPDQ